MAILVTKVDDNGVYGAGDWESLDMRGKHYSFLLEGASDIDDLPTQYSNPNVAPGSYAYEAENKDEYYLAANGLWTEYGNQPGTVELDSLDITQEPAKTAYEAGEALDTTGFAAVAEFTSKQQLVLGPSNVTFSVNAGTTAALTASDTTVTATYTSDGVTKTDTYSITVAAAPANNGGDGGDNSGGDGGDNSGE